MSYCPHCRDYYDDDNDTQPCCGGCGHPFSCGCSGHSDVASDDDDVRYYFFEGALDDDLDDDFVDDDLPWDLDPMSD